VGFGICFLAFVGIFIGIGGYAISKGGLDKILIFADGN